MPTSDGTELDETVAYVTLRRLQNRYADIVTRRAWPELAEIMRPDCVITVDLVDRAINFDGPTAIGDFIATQIEQFDFFEFVILNTVMEIDAEAGRATARMYIQEARQSVDQANAATPSASTTTTLNVTTTVVGGSPAADTSPTPAPIPRVRVLT